MIKVTNLLAKLRTIFPPHIIRIVILNQTFLSRYYYHLLFIF